MPTYVATCDNEIIGPNLPVNCKSIDGRICWPNEEPIDHPAFSGRDDLLLAEVPEDQKRVIDEYDRLEREGEPKPKLYVSPTTGNVVKTKPKVAIR